MKTNFFLFSILLIWIFLPYSFFGQNEASFLAPTEICANESFTITNTSSNVTSTFWNFCGIDFTNPAEGKVLENIHSLSNPVFLDIAKEGDDYFVFVMIFSKR